MRASALAYRGRLPSQPARPQTAAIVINDVTAMADTEGGGGATVMPATVEARTMRHSIVNPGFLGRDRLAPDRKR